MYGIAFVGNWEYIYSKIYIQQINLYYKMYRFYGQFKVTMEGLFFHMNINHEINT